MANDHVHPAFRAILDNVKRGQLTRDDWVMIVCLIDDAMEADNSLVLRERLEPIAKTIRDDILGHALMAAHNGGH